MYKEVNKCRICGNTNLFPILDLGNQYLTGVFPKSKNQLITCGPLELVKCSDEGSEKACGLVQLKHTYSHEEMYGDNYGYRSGLNQSMVSHLHNKLKSLNNFVKFNRGDLIVDIGSNDSTLLQGYPLDKELILVGVDPTGKKFKEYYPDHIKLIPDFFSKQLIENYFGNKKAKIVTSIAMFYDLDSPMDFMQEVYDVLADDGIWVLEQSYMPTMLEQNAYDTVCHEHLEYYSLKQIKWMTDILNLKIIDLELNNVNGGSFSITVAKSGSPYRENTLFIENILGLEMDKKIHMAKTYDEFRRRVFDHRETLVRLIDRLKSENKLVLGYGASTKGNVILQFCKFTEKDIPCIGEVNKDKFGSYTPGTLIPIISEEDARRMKPDYFMVLPWHFKNGILAKENEFRKSNGKLLFPLPSIEVV